MKRVALIVLAAIGVAGLSALGVWQLERRVWKLALIERVEQRVHAPAVPAPAPPQWPGITRENSEYLHVTAHGHFLSDAPSVLAQAVTSLGAGYWVLTPFQTDEGFVVLVNRGYVPQGPKDALLKTAAQTASPEPISVTGLLRISEPKGGFLRKNDPARNQWYSRDVQAISHALGLTDTAPYFIDAEAPARSDAAAAASPSQPGGPVPGLTVIAFHNSHLVYAITWFSLALMVAALGIRMARHR